MPTISGIRERCLAVISWPIGIDLLPSEQCFHHTLMSIRSSKSERCSTLIIWLIGVDLFLLEQYFDHFLVSVMGSPCEWCTSRKIFFVDITTSHIYQSSYNLKDSEERCAVQSPERRTSIIFLNIKPLYSL